MSAHASSPLPSERRLAANRANAQFSTGPTSPAGKAKSSLNAVRTGLAGRTVLLASEDVAAYKAHVARFQQKFQPLGNCETELVQSLADTQWRLDRIPNLETGLFALGHLRYAELFADEKNGQVRRAMIDAHILISDAKHFKNLHLHESRLSRRYQQDAKELKELQAQRKKEEEEQKQQQAQPATAPPKAKTLAAAANGFEFAISAEQTDPPQSREESDRLIVSADSVQTQIAVG